jgi:hypothetical protein
MAAATPVQDRMVVKQPHTEGSELEYRVVGATQPTSRCYILTARIPP